MLWINRLEKLGRLLLWLALAATVVLVPIGLVKERQTEADTLARVKEATREWEQKFEALERSAADKTFRIPFNSIQNGLSLLNTENATGQLWFTNVSPRGGYVCVTGEAKNTSSLVVTESLPACAEVPPFASAVHMTVMFAGRDLTELCKTAACSFRMKEAAGPTL